MKTNSLNGIESAVCLDTYMSGMGAMVELIAELDGFERFDMANVYRAITKNPEGIEPIVVGDGG